MWCFVWCGVASEMMWLAGVWLWRASVVLLGSRVCGGCLVGVGGGEGDVAWCGWVMVVAVLLGVIEMLLMSVREMLWLLSVLGRCCC